MNKAGKVLRWIAKQILEELAEDIILFPLLIAVLIKFLIFGDNDKPRSEESRIKN